MFNGEQPRSILAVSYWTVFVLFGFIMTVAFVGYVADLLLQITGNALIGGLGKPTTEDVVSQTLMPLIAAPVIFFSLKYSWRTYSAGKIAKAFATILIPVIPLTASALLISKHEPFAPLFGIQIVPSFLSLFFK